jgi:hypothetical protein
LILGICNTTASLSAFELHAIVETADEPTIAVVTPRSFIASRLHIGPLRINAHSRGDAETEFILLCCASAAPVPTMAHTATRIALAYLVIVLASLIELGNPPPLAAGRINDAKNIGKRPFELAHESQDGG